MQTEHTRVRFIDRELRKIEVERGDIVLSYPLNAIPDSLYEKIAGALGGDEPSATNLRSVYRDTVMKPAVCTFDIHRPYPINVATKIVRLTLTDSELEKKINDIEGKILSFQGVPFDDSIEDRIQFYRDLFIDDKKIDRFRIGAVEMYGDATYSNILNDPRVTLGFYWRSSNPPNAMSYQINAIAEMVNKDDPFYRYMWALRGLFSHRFLDLGRDEYVCAYKFWVSETHEKSLTGRTGFTP
ncbi:hypothetical protein EU537_05145 [Candidatus Thorarchaeota archaeon]|nr:MAG: hypothetical protein EU537_05145 [Candidatus Thorarchaeota archaeon]